MNRKNMALALTVAIILSMAFVFPGLARADCDLCGEQIGGAGDASLNAWQVNDFYPSVSENAVSYLGGAVQHMNGAGFASSPEFTAEVHGTVEQARLDAPTVDLGGGAGAELNRASVQSLAMGDKTEPNCPDFAFEGNNWQVLEGQHESGPNGMFSGFSAANHSDLHMAGPNPEFQLENFQQTAYLFQNQNGYQYGDTTISISGQTQ